MAAGGFPSTRDKYRRVFVASEPSHDPSPTEFRVSSQSSVRICIERLLTLFKRDDVDRQDVAASGFAISKAIAAAEGVRRRVPGLHMLTRLEAVENKFVYEPMEEGLDTVTVTRKVAALIITLSRSPLDASDPGYQPPLPAAEVRPDIPIELFCFDERDGYPQSGYRGDRRDRRGGKGGFSPQGFGRGGGRGRGDGRGYGYSSGRSDAGSSEYAGSDSHSTGGYSAYRRERGGRGYDRGGTHTHTHTHGYSSPTYRNSGGSWSRPYSGRPGVESPHAADVPDGASEEYSVEAASVHEDAQPSEPTTQSRAPLSPSHPMMASPAMPHMYAPYVRPMMPYGAAPPPMSVVPGAMPAIPYQYVPWMAYGMMPGAMPGHMTGHMHPHAMAMQYAAAGMAQHGAYYIPTPFGYAPAAAMMAPGIDAHTAAQLQASGQLAAGGIATSSATAALAPGTAPMMQHMMAQGPHRFVAPGAFAFPPSSHPSTMVGAAVAAGGPSTSTAPGPAVPPPRPAPPATQAVPASSQNRNA